MAIAASVILDRAATTLLDSSHVAWAAAELLDYLNAAQRVVVQVKADAYPKLASRALVAGVDQTLPADGLSVINVLRNTVSKRACKQTGLEALNSWYPDWAAETPRTDVREWVSDQRSPQRFMVYPPNDGTGSVEVLYGATPAVLAAASDNISLADSYEPALYQGVLHFAYAKNSRRQDLAKSAAALQAMIAMVTGKTATIKLNAPDLKQVEQAQS